MKFRMISLFSLFLPLAACTQDPPEIQNAETSSFLLYSIPWGWEYDHVTVLLEGRTHAVHEWHDPACENGKKQENIALCDDFILHVPTKRARALPSSLHNARSASAGVTDRIVYLLDARGDLAVLDTRWAFEADDGARLLLWSPGGSRVDILAGNARRHLAGVELQGQLTAFIMHGEHLYVLYRAAMENAWAWGVEKIDLIDFSVSPVGGETIVSSPSQIPDAIDVTQDGRLRVLRGTCPLSEIREN